MRKTLLSALLLLAATFSYGQATNPQATLANAVDVSSPSLWLNFNDATSSFKDSVSGMSFYPRVNIAEPATYTAGTSTPQTTVMPIALPAGNIASFTIKCSTATTGTVELLLLSFSGMSGTVQASALVTTAATTFPQTFYSGTNFTPITATAGEYAGVYGPSGCAVSYATGTSYNIYYLSGALPGGASTYANYTGGALSLSVSVVATGGTITAQQPGFDNTNNTNYSAEFVYNAYNPAPNNTLGSTMEWNTPWTMMLQINKLNWDHSANKLVLASKGDSSGYASNVWWQLYVQQNAGNGYASQLCFARSGPAPYTALSGAAFVTTQTWCSVTNADAMPNTFNYNVIVEDNGSGGSAAIGLWINGLAQTITAYTMTGNGFGGITAAVASGGTGYIAPPTLSSTGGGTNCNINGSTATVSGGAVTGTSIYSYGCTSAPTILVTAGGMSGINPTPTAALGVGTAGVTNYPLAAGSVTSITVQTYTAAAGVLQVGACTHTGGAVFTNSASVNLTLAATTSPQTFTAPTNFTAFTVSQGQYPCFASASGNSPALGASGAGYWIVSGSAIPGGVTYTAVSGGVSLSFSVSNPGTGAAITATSYPMSMNSTVQPLMVPGFVNNSTYYGPGGTDTGENPLYVDEFAIFPGNLSFGQITNIFYQTKFYQNLVYPGLTANPPLVIFNDYGCGPDFSGDQTVAMVIGAHKAGLIRLIGFNDDDGQPNGSNSVGWFRQMLDQAGLADVPVSVGAGSPLPNLGGCPAGNITTYNANTDQNPAHYESALTMYRTLFAKYPTTPIYVLMTQTANGYSSFELSPPDGISSLTGLQLESQNYANGGWVNAFEGNFYTTPSSYLSLLNTIGSHPIYFEGGNPAAGGPGIRASRTANDPLYMTSIATLTDTITGWTNENLAQVISPYFLGGVQITASGGTGYAAFTGFTSVGGGPNCSVAGLMLSNSGVPSSFDTPWYTSIPSTYDGLGYGCTPAVFTATGSGKNLTVSAISLGTITIGDTISGTGIPTGTTIVSQTSGTTGGVGVYVTSAATTASATSVTRTPTIVLTAPTGTGVTLTVLNGIFIKPYEGSATASYAVWPNVWGYSQVFTWFQSSLMDAPTTGAPRPY